MRYIIVGNSFAGIFAIQAIREHDPTGKIIVITDEIDRPYSRALIHEYLAKMIDDKFMYLRDEGFYKRLKVKVVSGIKATGLKANTHELITEDGVFKYDKLLLAVGGAPFIPPGINGLDEYSDSVFTFTRWYDADRIDQALKSAENVIVIGAGLIGMQVADAIAHRNKNVSVIELANHILPMVVDELSADMIREELEGKMQFHTSDSIEELIGQDGKLESVKLRSGKVLPADIVTIAVGVRPNVGWLRESEITIDRGIIVDEYMRTNLPDIFAAGDCAQGLEIISGSRMVLATIPIASEQGYIAGLNMVGVNAQYRGGIPLNAMQMGKLQIISYGYVKESENQEVISLFDEANKVYRKIVLENDKITGVLLVRSIDRAGLFRYLIENRIDVSSFKDKLIRDDFGVADLPEHIRNEMFLKPQSRITA